jgi:bifunctional isochorismate lyase/aryl carrier protein
MSLPRIAPYRVPAVQEFPDNRAHWPLDPSRALLLVHDMQRYFVDAFVDPQDPSGPIGAAVANIRTLLGVARRIDLPVVFSAQPPRQATSDRGLLGDFWGPGLQDAEQARIVDALAPADGERVITKWRYTAFLRTPLADLMRASCRDQLIVVGVYAHLGCLLTAADAFMHDIEPFLVGDAVADFSEADHRSALTYAAGRCARVISTATASAELRPADLLAQARR